MNDMMSIFKHNLPAKLISVMAAIILWFFVMNEQNPFLENSFSVPIVVNNAPENCRITIDRERAKLKLRGQRSALLAAPRDDFFAYLDLQGMQEGEHEVQTEAKLPSGLELISISPDMVKVKIERIITREMSVSILLTGKTADGYSVSRLDPSVVKTIIKGAQKDIDKVDRVVGYVHVSEANNKDFGLEVNLVAVDERGRAVENITVRDSRIHVGVKMSNAVEKKSVPVKPVILTNLPAGYKLKAIHAEPAMVEVSGSTIELINIDVIETLHVSLADATAPFSKKVRLKVPGGVSASTDEVTVSVEIVEK